MQRAAIYTRISKDRNGESLAVERQEEACRKLADLLGAEVIEPIYSDNDISAFNGKARPGFERLLEDIAVSRVDVLLCWHTDRLYRTLKDLVRLTEAGPALLIKTVQGGDIDLSNATGKMLARILGSVAEQESEHHSERRKAAYVQRAQLGLYDNHGFRTFGYGGKVKCRDDDCDCDGHHQIGVTGEPYEPEAGMYRKAVADLLEGKSMRSIAKEWNASGITTTVAGMKRKFKGREYKVEGEWSGTRIRRLLLNPRYAGIKIHLGKRAGTGDWTPLIDEGTYQRVVAELKDPARLTITSFEKKWVGSGVYLCGVCGATMAVSWPGRNQGRKYACPAHSCVMRSGQALDDYVENAVLERLSQPDANLLIAQRGVDVADLQDRRAGLVRKLDQLVELLDDGTFDGPKAREKAAEYKGHIAEIDSMLARAARTSPTAALLATGRELRQRWEKLKPAVRGEIINEIAVVTVNRAARGERGFNPDYVDLTWKVA